MARLRPETHREVLVAEVVAAMRAMAATPGDETALREKVRTSLDKVSGKWEWSDDEYQELKEAAERALVSPEELHAIETHILGCEDCVARLDRAEQDIATIQAAVRELEESERHGQQERLSTRFKEALERAFRFLRGVYGERPKKQVSESRSGDLLEMGEPQASEAAIAETIQLATQILGDRDEVFRWLGTPVPDLDYATPVSLLKTKEGAEEVRAELERLAHGVY